MHSSIKVRKSFRSRLRRRAQFLALLLGTAPMAGQVFGQNTYWNISSAVANNWGTASNWVPAPTGGTGGTAPNATVTANFSSDAASLAGTRQIFLAGNRSALGLVFNAPGPFLLRSNGTATTVQTLTIGAGGITVNATTIGVAFQTTVPGVTTSSGQVNTLLSTSQTWTNHSTGNLDWNGRIAGVEAVTLTKEGTGTLVLRANNTTTVGTTSGLRGKIQVNAGTLQTAIATGLGIRDALTTETTSAAAIAALQSDTTIASGATLDINNISNTNEFVRFSGTGVGGNGAIVNNQTGTGINNGLQQVALVGNATIGGATAKWDIRGVNPNEGRLFQDGFTLTKTGGNIVSITNTNVYGGGTIDVAQGTLRLEAGTEILDGGTISLQSGTILQFTNQTSDVNRSIVLNAGSQVQNTGNDTATTVSAGMVINAASTISVVDNNNATVVGSLNLTGPTTGTGNVIKVGSGRLGLNLQPGYTGNISVQGGGFDLTTSGGAVASNIALSSGNLASGTIFRVGVGGEGQTTGTLTLLDINFITFDPSTTGAGQHLRVGAVDQSGAALPATVRLKAPIVSGTGLVVLESAANDLLTAPAGFNFLGRSFGNGLTWNASQVLLDYAAGNLVWRGNDGTNPTFWDTQATTNWDNGGTADIFFDLDITTFDDTVGIGSTTITPQGSVSTGTTINFNNNAVNFAITPIDAGGVVEGSQSVLNKTGTGTVTINTFLAGAAHNIGTVNVNGGQLVSGFLGLENQTHVASVFGALNVGSGGTYRNSFNLANSGHGTGTTINVAAGGLYQLNRSGVNGTVTTTAATALVNRFSGAGDVQFNSFSTTLTTHLDSYGQFTLNAQNSAFSGRFVLNNSRINIDNASGDELGTATVVVPSGASALLTGTISNQGNIFQIAGNGWASEPTATGPLGALRFNTANARIGSTSSVVLTADARVVGSTLGNIDAPISGGFNLQFGAPAADVNGTVILSGANTYTGNTTVTNHVVGASSNSAFGTGTLNLFGTGVTTARVTQLNVSSGVTISNPIVLNTSAGQNGRGAIEGAGLQQVINNGIGLGEVSGTITLENLAPNNGHFGSGIGVGAALRVSGAVNVPAPATDAVVHRSSTTAGYTEFTGGGGNYTKFNLAGGTVRLGANNGINAGLDLITRNIGARGDFDMRDFNQTINSVVRGSTVGGSTFNLVNSGTGVSTLTITGSVASEIQNIPLNASGGIVNINKSGSGSLVLSGNTANLTNPGTYTISGGTFGVTAGQMAAGTVITTGATVAGGGTSGPVTVSGGGFSPGASPGTLNTGNLTVSGSTFYDWEILDANGGTPTPPGVVTGLPGTEYDRILVNGTLDLSALTNMVINVKSLSSIGPDVAGNANNFDQTLNYSFLLFDPTSLVGFDPSDFTLNLTGFSNTFTGTFSVGVIGDDIVLNYQGIPEPSSIILLVSCMGMGILRHRSRRSTKDNASS